MKKKTNMSTTDVKLSVLGRCIITWNVHRDLIRTAINELGCSPHERLTMFTSSLKLRGTDLSDLLDELDSRFSHAKFSDIKGYIFEFVEIPMSRSAKFANLFKVLDECYAAMYTLLSEVKDL